MKIRESIKQIVKDGVKLPLGFQVTPDEFWFIANNCKCCKEHKGRLHCSRCPLFGQDARLEKKCGCWRTWNEVFYCKKHFSEWNKLHTATKMGIESCRCHCHIKTCGNGCE